MSEKFRGERRPIDKIEREFGIKMVRAIERLQEVAKEGKNFESLMHTLKRILASEGVEISESRINSLIRMLSENKRELGIDSGKK